MPRGDGTGPMGMGPMTGRAAGYCAGYPTPGFINPYGARFAGPGQPYGSGQAMGMPAYPGAMPMGPAYGYGGYAPYGGYGMGPALAPGQELEFLKQQAEVMRQQLDQITERMKQLETESS